MGASVRALSRKSLTDTQHFITLWTHHNYHMEVKYGLTEKEAIEEYRKQKWDFLRTVKDYDEQDTEK